MNDSLIKLYNHLPAPLRSVAASLRGQYLRSWRYGNDTEGLIEEALDRESWSPSQWKKWQEERLAYVLHRAATQVPYYREQWSGRRRQGDLASYEYLENWPILKKDALRQNPLAFVAEDRNPKRMYLDHTSGTSGTPLKIWSSKHTLHAYFAIYEARIRRWHGLSINQRWAILGGQPVVPVAAKQPPFWVYNASMNQLYLSANHVSARNVRAYADAINRYGPTHMIAYPSSASVLAREIIAAGLPLTCVTMLITNAEPVHPWQRSIITGALGSQVRETYGMAETVAAASECQHGKLHLWPDTGLVEIFSDTEDIPQRGSSKPGRFICTGLLNPDMPLIRYEVGDRGQIAPETEHCSCGRTLPTVGRIEGRTNDVLIAKDGRRVYWLNPVFYGLPIREAQIVQQSVNRLRVRYVSAPDFKEGTKLLIAERLQRRMGEVDVIMEQVEMVPREANGKFRAVVCELSNE